MTEAEYNFLTSREKRTGQELQESFDYCRNFGWCSGLDLQGRPVLTRLGIKAIKNYKNSS